MPDIPSTAVAWKFTHSKGALCFDVNIPDAITWAQGPNFKVCFLAFDKRTRGARSRTHRLLLKGERQACLFNRIINKNNAWGEQNFVKMRNWVRDNITYKNKPLMNVHVYMSGDYVNGQNCWLIVYQH